MRRRASRPGPRASRWGCPASRPCASRLRRLESIYASFHASSYASCVAWPGRWKALYASFLGAVRRDAAS